jgi:hypothetical protein
VKRARKQRRSNIGGTIGSVLVVEDVSA